MSLEHPISHELSGLLILMCVETKLYISYLLVLLSTCVHLYLFNSPEDPHQPAALPRVVF